MSVQPISRMITALCAFILVLLMSACTTGGEVIRQEATVQVLSETAIARVTEVHAAQLTAEPQPVLQPVDPENFDLRIPRSTR
jgi:hypothetical protein